MAKDGVGRRGVLAAAGASGLMAGAPATAAAKAGGSSGASRLTTPPEAIIETKLGKLRDAARDGVYSFKGAPYGRSAGGASRFLPPRPRRAGRGEDDAGPWALLSAGGARGLEE